MHGQKQRVRVFLVIIIFYGALGLNREHFFSENYKIWPERVKGKHYILINILYFDNIIQSTTL